MDDKTIPHWLWPLVKWSLCAVVSAFVFRQGWKLWQTTPQDAVQIDAIWLIPATLFYVVGWMPSVWFWRAMLGGFGRPPRWSAVVRAYYIGHLGKYVPGKALVLVIRAALLRESGCAAGVSAVTAMYETLATMGAGAGLAVALSPFATSPTLWQLLPAWCQPLRQTTWLMPLLVLVGTLACLPLIAKLFTRIAIKITKSTPAASEQPGCWNDAPALGITIRTLLHGLAVVSLGWCLFVLSLGCVLRSLGVATDLTAFPVWLAATTLSTVGGFVILIAPGGLGVRELLLTEVLQSQPGIAEAQAFLAAWLLRAVWLGGELLAAGLLWCLPAWSSGSERTMVAGSAPLSANRPTLAVSRFD